MTKVIRFKKITERYVTIPSMQGTIVQTPVSIRDAYASARNVACFDLGLDRQEEEALRSLRIRHTKTYDNFGDIPALEAESGRFLNSFEVRPLVAAQIAHTVSRLTYETISAFEARTAWITLRASVPSAAFDVPRWHRDGYFFSPYSGDQRKVAIALIGPGTLFAQLSQEWQAAFNECAKRHQNDPMSLVARRGLADIVNQANASKALDPSQGVIFRVGSDQAAIHSEPPIAVERLFLSIVPGSEAQIAELRERWRTPMLS